jgi:hypothetical protein
MFSISYLGGITAGNIPMAVLLGLGTGGVIILNNIAAWTAWASNQPQGYGEYKFFFYGWRTLTPGWHKFILVWQISDSIEAATCVLIAITLAIYSATFFKEQFDEDQVPWWLRYPAIPLGAIAMLIVSVPEQNLPLSDNVKILFPSIDMSIEEMTNATLLFRFSESFPS